MNKNTPYSESANVCLTESKLSISHPLPASGNAKCITFIHQNENIPLIGMKIALCAENGCAVVIFSP